jgi:hypothetical protein
MLAIHPTIALDPIPGFPGYRTSRLGGVFSTKTRGGKLLTHAVPLKPYLDKNEYLIVDFFIDRKRYVFKVHQLILIVYAGPCPPGMECLHGPGGKLDNSVGNLRYGTHADNMKDWDRNKATRVCGSNHHLAKVTEADIPEIRAMRPCDAARKYGITRVAARQIKIGNTWKHVK